MRNREDNSRSVLTPRSFAADGNRGVTLVEVMIALCVLLIVFMGLIQASLLSINHNTRNMVRDESVRIASDYITRARATNFDALDSTLTDIDEERHFRKYSVHYTVSRTVASVGPDMKTVAVKVTFTYPGDSNTTDYTLKSLVRR